MIIQILSKTQWLAKCHGKRFDSWLYHIQISIATSGFSFNHLFFIRWNSVGFYWLFCGVVSLYNGNTFWALPYSCGPSSFIYKSLWKGSRESFFFKKELTISEYQTYTINEVAANLVCRLKYSCWNGLQWPQIVALLSGPGIPVSN